MNTYLTFIFSLLLFTTTLSAQVVSQQSTNEGFSITGSLGYHTWNADDISGEALGGIAISLSPSYGFNDHIQAYINLEFAPAVESGSDFIDSYPVHQIELGARFNFAGTTTKLRPFVQATIANHSLTFNDDINQKFKFSGSTIGFGGGLKYFVETNMAIQAMVQYDFGSYDNNSIDNFTLDQSFDMNTGRMMFGFVYVLD